MSAIVGNAPVSPGAERRESRFRLTGGAVVTFFWFLLFMGTSWDIQWHTDVGPDKFWTAPHTMMYTGVAVSGLVSLYMVIATTLKFRRGEPGVTRENTTPWLGLFHAPLGFIVSGLGVVGFLLSGGFDEFWHGLYGFDVTIWSPPHISLLLSGVVGVFGAIYAMGSEVTRARARGRLSLLSTPSIGFASAVAVLLIFTSNITPPAMSEEPFVGPFSLWPLMAGTFFSLTLALSASVLRMPGAATLMAAIITLIRLLAVVLPPVLVDWLARAEGLPYKPDKVGFTLAVLATPAFFIVAGLVTDLVIWATQNRMPRTAGVLLAGALAPVALFAVERPWFKAIDVLPWMVKFESVRTAMLTGHTATFYPTMAAVAVTGALAAWLGWQFGIYVRYTEK